MLHYWRGAGMALGGFTAFGCLSEFVQRLSREPHGMIVSGVVLTLLIWGLVGLLSYTRELESRCARLNALLHQHGISSH